jgi:hypothetical protein
MKFFPLGFEGILYNSVLWSGTFTFQFRLLASSTKKNIRNETNLKRRLPKDLKSRYISLVSTFALCKSVLKTRFFLLKNTLICQNFGNKNSVCHNKACSDITYGAC